MSRALWSMLVLMGCGFTPVEELSSRPNPDAGLSAVVGALPLSVAWRTCGPADGTAMDVMTGPAPTCAQPGTGLHLSLWGALTPGSTKRVGLAPPSDGLAETCTAAGCTPLSGTVTVVSVTSTELVGEYALTMTTGERAMGTFTAPICDLGVVCG